MKERGLKDLLQLDENIRCILKMDMSFPVRRDTKELACFLLLAVGKQKDCSHPQARKRDLIRVQSYWSMTFGL